MGPNLIRQVIETRKPLRVWDTHSEDAGLEPHVLAALDALNMHKMYLRPLVSHERVLGLLILMRHAVQRVPGRSETLLETLAENFTILIENWQLQNQLRKLSIMEERHRLARELHDSVTQSLFILSLTARGLQSSLGAMANGNEQALNVLVEQTKAVQNEMRRLINELRPIDLEEDTFEDALRQHIQSVRYSTNTEVQFTLSGNVNAIPKPIQRNLNRIAQEALSNIARHAQAKHAAVRLEVGDEMVTLTIQDDGVGFDLPTVALQESNSLGLTSMRERAELLGGALLVRSQPGRETVITAQIPITQQLEEHVGI
jgi:signal transduction histidine kinase